jgi:hypothetical protein
MAEDFALCGARVLLDSHLDSFFTSSTLKSASFQPRANAYFCWALIANLSMRDGQLRSVAVIESTGWYPVASVWVQEWFDEKIPKRIRVLGHRRPYAVLVEFPASLPENQRKHSR